MSIAEAPVTVLRRHDGGVVPLDVAQWAAPADPVEQRRFEGIVGPVLDIGCGPGRLVVALAERGVAALGVDASPVAVGQATQRNAAALVRSVFDPMPGVGRWRTALLFDGNIGIGGDPARLLDRVSELLARGGLAVVEVAEPGSGLHRFPARIERGDARSPWFPWAVVGAEAIIEVAADCGFRLQATVADEGRWFVELRRLGR